MPFSFCSAASGVDTRRLGHSVVQPKKKEPPTCHQLPHVIRVSTKNNQLLLGNTTKTTRLRRSRVDDRTLPGSRGTSLTDCRTTAVLTMSVCTRGHDPDAEPNCFSSVFLLGMWWCSDCDDTLGSLRGGVQKLVIRTTPASQKWSEHQQKHLLFDNSRTTSSRRKSTGGRTDATKLHKGALTEYCPCQCHTGPCTIILGHRSRCVAAHLKPHAATLGPFYRCTESDKGQSQHRVLPSACCFKTCSSAESFAG